MQLQKFKKAVSKKKQPFQLSNFSPLCSVTTWTWWKRIRIIIQSDYFAAFNTPVATFFWFFTCCVHKIKFKRLITHSNYCCIPLKQLLKHYLERFLVGPTLIVSLTVVAGLLVASLSGTNLPERASLTLVDVLLIFLIFNYYKISINYYLTEQKINSSMTKKKYIQLIEY